MSKLDELIDQYYNKFVGLPNGKPIVRQNQRNDAFEIVVLETLYGKEKELDVQRMVASDVLKIAKFIVAPPDDGIDIIVEREEIDGSSFDFIQVKNAELSQLDIQQALSYMEKTIEKYLKKASDVNINLREALSEANFSKSDKSNCRFILVHRGVTNFFKGQKEDKEIVITGTELEIIRDGAISEVPRVPIESFGADAFNNFIFYEESQDNPAILMNLCGYDLARLAIKYTNTSLGRNILFGQNLRESLSKSKTYDGMAATIRKEPEKFWFYNNGVTIIAEDYDTEYNEDQEKKVDRLTLKDFSIINGAQTTSALGRFLKEAEMNCNEEDIEKLKRVYVLARILKVVDDEFKAQIAIFNNTQNPITTRDMASNREEQLQLYNGLVSGATPNIYVEVRRGMKPPADVRLYKHQNTTNVELAQLAYAGFLRDPFIAKDKKNAIFDTDYKQTEGFLLNEYYHKLFHYGAGDTSEGILFKKTKDEINELLFVHYLYKMAKKNLLAVYKERIADATTQLESCDDSQKKKFESRITDYERLKSIANICVFYCIAYYYGFKEEFPNDDSGCFYRYEDFYSSDKEFQKKLVEGFRDLFLTGTIEVIKELTVNDANLNNWIRDRKSTRLFLDKVEDRLQLDMTLESKYKDYIVSFKNSP
ncbi:MAG: AIPR family protein [Lachnospiraceae bacterium]|nr:AIPR family protein [Lachnospiraceae bacterium]